MDADLNQRVRALITAGDEIGAIKLLRQEEKLSLHAARGRVSALSVELTGPEPQDAAYIFTGIGGFALARYPGGAEVVVHYDPEHPQRALLDTSLQGPWIRLMAFVLGLPLYLWYRPFARAGGQFR